MSGRTGQGKGRTVSAETRRKMSEAQKAAWRRRHAAGTATRPTKPKPAIHINYGHSARSADPKDRCFYCDKHFAVMAYTYFGAPVCGRHWDGKWRKTEEGECDPPFVAIKQQQSGRWL